MGFEGPKMVKNAIFGGCRPHFLKGPKKSEGQFGGRCQFWSFLKAIFYFYTYYGVEIRKNVSGHLYFLKHKGNVSLKIVCFLSLIMYCLDTPLTMVQGPKNASFGTFWTVQTMVFDQNGHFGTFGMEGPF